MAEILTRVEMAAIIDGGTPLVFNGKLYTNSASLPTQQEIDDLYAGVGQGAQGEQGEQGLSAYDVAVANGFVGDEEAWLASLAGSGNVDSVNGDNGPDVVLTTNDISQDADANYVTDAEKVILSNTSGTNSGDQDLSPYFHKTNDDSDDITEGSTKKFVTSADKTNWNAKIDGSALNASNLTSGTIPDARFPATLPAVSGANLTNLPPSGAPDVQTFTASGTWNKPAGKTIAIVQLWSGGRGGTGGYGYNGNSNTGGGGGVGGAYLKAEYLLSQLPSTVAVTIGAGGAGGAGGTGVAGVAGDAGGSTSFGSFVSVSPSPSNPNDAYNIALGGAGGNSVAASGGGGGAVAVGGFGGGGGGGGASRNASGTIIASGTGSTNSTAGTTAGGTTSGTGAAGTDLFKGGTGGGGNLSGVGGVGGAGGIAAGGGGGGTGSTTGGQGGAGGNGYAVITCI